MKFNLILFIQETIIPTTKFGIVLPLLIFGAVGLVAGWLSHSSQLRLIPYLRQTSSVLL